MTYYQNPYLGYYPTIQPMVYPQQPMIEQPQQQSVSVQPQQTQPSIGSFFIWVQGEAGAKSYPVARGTTLPLFDTEGDFLYIKSVDTNGVPLPLVKKIISDPPIEVEIADKGEVNSDEYVTKQAYDEMKRKYEDLEFRIMELETKPVSTITSNFNGNTFNNSRKGKDNGDK